MFVTLIDTNFNIDISAGFIKILNILPWIPKEIKVREVRDFKSVLHRHLTLIFLNIYSIVLDLQVD